MAISPFKLSCSLYGHNADVRCVATTPDGQILSGSRDRTAKVWTPNESLKGYHESRNLSCHSNFVSCICVVPAFGNFTTDFIVTGSQDHAIRVFQGSALSPIHILKGHTNTVCKLITGCEENTIISSSWDQTARIWDLLKGTVIVTLSGHESGVWAALQLPCGTIVTASADKTIKIWMKNGVCLKTLTGHSDCVRDLAAVGPKEVLSVSNDATIRHWNIATSECLNTIYGHSHFIYSVAVFPNSGATFATTSEDRCVKVWGDGEELQSIELPAASVWCVAVLPNGDLVTGSSDSVVRVFSSEPSRQAGPDELQVFDDQVRALKTTSSQKIGDVNVSDLPGKDVLYEPGKQDGQTKMVREADGKVSVYSWVAGESRWDKIGDVMGAGGSEGASESGRPTYNGKEYDYVFSVDIEEGQPPLKLPFNHTDDPWMAAQKFIHDHNLSQHYLEQVANFIVSNAGLQTLPPPSQNFADPFTGEARYIPGTGPSNGGGRGATNSDPFTGSSSYNTSTPRPNLNSTNNQSAAAPPSSAKYFPQREFLRFDQANVKLISEKLHELNQQVQDCGAVCSLSSEEMGRAVRLCEVGVACSDGDLQVLDRLLQWPQDLVFPGLDIMRLAIRNPQVNAHLCSKHFISRLTNFLGPNSTAVNKMLALRVLSNMLSAEAGLALAATNRVELLHLLRDVTSPFSKPLQVAMATLLLNMAIVIRRSELPDGGTEALAVAEDMLRAGKLTDEEAVFRALVALGTLLNDTGNRHSYSTAFTPLLIKYDNYGPRVTQCALQIVAIIGE